MGSWLRMSKLNVPVLLLVPGSGDRVHEPHDRHDVGQVVTRNYLLQELHVHGAWRPVVHPVGRVGAVGDDVDRVLAPRRLGPAEALPLGRAYAASKVSEDLALWEVLQDLLDYPDALL